MRHLLVAIALFAPALAHADPKAADVSDSMPDIDTQLDNKTMTATASSTLCEKKPNKQCHEAAAVLDEDQGTAWCEGAKDDGVGQSLTITFAKPTMLSSVGMIPMFSKTFAIAESNNRIETVEIATDAGTFTADFDDFVPVVKKQNGVHEVRDPCGCGDETCMSRDERIQGGERYASLPAPVKTSKITITIKSIFRGTKYHDTCVSSFHAYGGK